MTLNKAKTACLKRRNFVLKIYRRTNLDFFWEEGQALLDERDDILPNEGGCTTKRLEDGKPRKPLLRILNR